MPQCIEYFSGFVDMLNGDRTFLWNPHIHIVLDMSVWMEIDIVTFIENHTVLNVDDRPDTPAGVPARRIGPRFARLQLNSAQHISNTDKLFGVCPVAGKSPVLDKFTGPVGVERKILLDRLRFFSWIAVFDRTNGPPVDPISADQILYGDPVLRVG